MREDEKRKKKIIKKKYSKKGEDTSDNNDTDKDSYLSDIDEDGEYDVTDSEDSAYDETQNEEPFLFTDKGIEMLKYKCHYNELPAVRKYGNIN